jgi:hypothetical protein
MHFLAQDIQQARHRKRLHAAWLAIHAARNADPLH